MTFLTVLGVIFTQSAALLLAMSGAWAIERRTGNAGWVDFVWTLATGFVGAASALLPLGGAPEISGRQMLVAGLIGIWAIRLSLHIAQRNFSKPDDPRYAKLRAEWGDRASPEMLVLLLKQAVVSIPLVLAIALAAHRPGHLGLLDVIAVGVFMAAVLGETISDRQLRTHTRSTTAKGEICTTGLWRYSRHPNYFFEWLHWLAYPIIAADVSGGYAVGWLAVLAPAMMYWLLRYVSGVPPLEEHMLQKHGTAYRAYQKTTNAFFPWVHRHG